MQKVTSPFELFELRPDQQKVGQLLSLETKAVLHNIRTAAAWEKVQLKYDPLHPELFLQAEAELQGRIGVLTEILDNAEISATQPTNPEGN